MAARKGFYEVYDYGDTLTPANRIKLEHHIYISDENTDISTLKLLSPERLQSMREESAAAEKAIFEKLRNSTAEWEEQAAQTKLYDKAIEYVKTPPVKHTSNQWTQDGEIRGRHSISNMVYAMSYNLNERHSYGYTGKTPAPLVWELTWSVYTNAPNSPYNQRGQRIAGQERKVYSDKTDMEKYLSGRIKAYSHLFTEISPPIPQEYAKNFRVNGQLLPGYTLKGEEPKPPEHTDTTVGGDLVSDNKELRKEREDMTEPIKIRLTTHELQEGGGVWLKLPATAEQLNAAFTYINARDNAFYINGIETPVVAVKGISLENVQKAGLDELNYLAAALQSRDERQIAKFNTVAGIANADNIHYLTEIAQNTGVYDFHPDILNSKQLGEYTLKHSRLIQIPDEWAAAIDAEILGKLAAEHEKGRFTESGYIAPNGEKWEPVTEIPQEYRIAPKTEPKERGNIQRDNPNVKCDAANTYVPTAVTAAPIVLEADNPRDRMKEITDKLEKGIRGIFDSEQYKTYLKTLAKFHNYSFNNCILIAMQRPGASRIAGFNAWRDDFKRPVKKGEKGIKIFAPAPFKTKKVVDKVDSRGNPVIGADGRRVKDEIEVTVPAFRIANVFDIDQTAGEPLPQIGISELSGNVDQYKDLFAALLKASPVPVGFEAITSGAKGYFNSRDKCIAINTGMSELQNIKTLIHELAHSRLDAVDTKNPIPGQKLPDRRTGEVIAESIAYTVSAHYGLDTSDYSFGYIAGWSGDKELDALKSSLDIIRKEADAIITEVDKHFAELLREKEHTAEKTKQDTPAIPSGDVRANNEQEASEQTKSQGDTFMILQLKDGDETRDLRFEPFDKLKSAPDMANYDRIYTALLGGGTTLDKIYFTFNMDKPEDFRGHSLSVSDVVVVNRDGRETAFYVNDKGFKELPDFLTQKEQSRETPVKAAEIKGKAEPSAPAAPIRQTIKTPAHGENVAAIEAKVKAGKVVSISNFSDAMKKDKQASQQVKTATHTAVAQTAKRQPAAKKGDWKLAQSQQAWDYAQGKSTPARAAQPSIKQQLAAGKRQIAGEKTPPARTHNKFTGLGE